MENSELKQPEKKEPPGFLIFIAIIQIVLALILLALVPTSALNIRINGAALSGLVRIVAAFFIVTLLGAPGFGLLLRQKWAWWIASGFYFSLAFSFIVHPILDVILGNGGLSLIRMITGFGTNGLVFWYFLSGQVWKFFEFRQLSRRKAIVIFLIINGGITILPIAAHLTGLYKMY